MRIREWFGFVLLLAVASPLCGQVVLEIESRDHRVSPPKSGDELCRHRRPADCRGADRRQHARRERHDLPCRSARDGAC